jgi:hypothetical protein
VAVPPEERPLPPTREPLGCGLEEVGPPQPHQQHQPRDRDDHETGGDALGERSLHRVGRREDALPEQDDREEAVSLGDVPGMPRRPALALGPDRYRQVGEGEHDEGDDAPFRRHEEPQDPPDLHDRDADRVAPGRRAAFGMLGRRPDPLTDQADPHDRVAERHGAEVAAVERTRHACREHEHPAHLHDGQDAVEGVIGVVRRCEPGEVHPGPPDGEEHHEERADRLEVPLGDGVRELEDESRDRDDEDQVEQQLERGRRPVVLVLIAAAHPDVEAAPALVRA